MTRRELAVIFAFWTFLAVLSSINWMIEPATAFRGRIDPSRQILLAFVENWTWAAMTPLIFMLSSRLTLRRIPMLIGIGVLISIAVFIFLGFARDIILDPRRHFHPLMEVMRARFAPQLLYYFAILAAGFAREYFLRDVQLRGQLAEARLHALRMQINPHFLFNTLHAISAMVDRDPAGVRKMIARLSDLLRYATDTEAADVIPLRQELDFLGRYIEIMEVRFQGRLRVTRDIDPAALEALVPNLILQPIVENSLEHGASRAMGEGIVEIRARREDGRVIVSVRDNGPGVAASGGREGVGLANTRERLAALYASAASLTLTSAPGGGAIAEISLPYRHV